MSFLDRVINSYKFLDKNGLKTLIGLIKNHDVHWTGTHAEYEAQKDTIPDYAILHFTDDYDENVQVGVYSTEETKTGEIWIDGKPLYQKTFDVGSIPSSGRKNIADLTSNSIKYVVSITGFCYKEGDYNAQRPLPLVDINPDNSIRIDINGDNGTPYLRILTAADWTGYKGYVTIKYTKTTDA